MKTNSKGQKLYPFNAFKNQLNLAKRARYYEDIANDPESPDELAEKAQRLFEFFEDVAFGYPIQYVTGRQLELLRNGVAWAEADRMAKADNALGYGWEKRYNL